MLKIISSCSSSIRIRCYSTKDVRVRFAPSPTGMLHIGGLRTALYNYVFAKSQGGIFILRIEDTDQSRMVLDTVTKIESDLKWVGITPDESPSVGGKYGPYVQSERKELYRQRANELVQKGSAYRCFCTESRLDLLRRDLLRRQQVPKYDNKCRMLTEDEIQNKLAESNEYCIRFKLTPYTTPFDDIVYGPITCNVAALEGDPVILKQDGFPTYHLANVVDDHYMRISHVLRGVEWLPSTTKHILLYQAFNWKPPQFGHLPLLLNPDGSKLSKRQGGLTVEDQRESGILPLALVNFVTSCGGGFARDPNQIEKSTYRTMDEMCQQFDLKMVNSHSCQLHMEKLPEFNRTEIRRLVKCPDSLNELVITAKKIILMFIESEGGCELSLSNEKIKEILDWSSDRIFNLNELVGPNFAFLWVEPTKESLREYEQLLFDSLPPLLEELAELRSFEKSNILSVLRNFALKRDLKFNKFMKFLRSALSGLTHGPGVAEMMELLGKETVSYRLTRAMNFHSSFNTSSDGKVAVR